MRTLSFDLHKLGWKAFQDLVGYIFSEVMGQTFQQFADGPDGGRDGAFHGQWSSDKGNDLSGSFTIQCKHTSESNKALPDSVVDKELPKIERLSQQGLADNYIFVTNHTISGEKAKAAEKCFIDAGANHAVVYGAEWINKKITYYPVLRRFVPRLYGLGDLSQIVTHQAHRQTLTVLRNNVSDLKCFVPTEAYRKSANALYNHGFVLLLGEPGSGKSMIANLLALSAFDEKKLQTLKLYRPEDLNNLYNPDDPGQFLWVDDAFGVTQHDPIRALEWNHRQPLLRTAIDNGALVVFTSRDYIFNAAKEHLIPSFFELIDDEQIVIKVEDLSENERQMILYNHLKCGNQPRNFRKSVKPWLIEAATTRRFLPEIARRFANQKFTKGLPLTRKHVNEFFNNPVKYLEDTLLNFAPAERAALALVFIAGGRLPVPIPEDEKTLHTITSLQSNIGDVKASLNALNNAFIYRIREDGREYWCFRHPSIRDAFAALVGANPEFIDIYLAGTPADKLVDEVTCGDLSIKGVKIIVPPEKYPIVIEKLSEIGKREPSRFSDPVDHFLAHRCNGEFLEKYFTEREPMASLPNQIEILHMFDNSLKILIRLQDDGRLPNEIRLATVKKIVSLADQNCSLEFTQEPIVHLLTIEEKDALIDQVKDVIFTNKTDLIQDLRDTWDPEDDPDFIFTTYEETLALIMEESEDEFEQTMAEELLDEVAHTIQEMESQRELHKIVKEMEIARDLSIPSNTVLKSKQEAIEIVAEKRNIFDDIDE